MPNPELDNQVPAFASASSVDYLPFTSALPCTTDCPVPTTSSSSASSLITSPPGGQATGVSASASTTKHSTSSSKALGAAMVRETGFGAAGLMVALGGAVLMI